MWSLNGVVQKTIGLFETLNLAVCAMCSEPLNAFTTNLAHWRYHYWLTCDWLVTDRSILVMCRLIYPPMSSSGRKRSHQITTRSLFTVHVTRHFMSSEGWRRTKLNELRKQKIWGAESQAVGEACRASFWPTLGVTDGVTDSCGFLADRTLIP